MTDDERYWLADGMAAANDGEPRTPPNAIKHYADPPALVKAWLRGWDTAKGLRQ